MLFLISAMNVVAQTADKPDVDPIVKGVVIVGAFLLFGSMALIGLVTKGKKQF